MRQLLCLFFLIATSMAQAAQQSVLPKHMPRKFRQAVDLLDGYRGEPASLDSAKLNSSAC